MTSSLTMVLVGSVPVALVLAACGGATNSGGSADASTSEDARSEQGSGSTGSGSDSGSAASSGGSTSSGGTGTSASSGSTSGTGTSSGSGTSGGTGTSSGAGSTGGTSGTGDDGGSTKDAGGPADSGQAFDAGDSGSSGGTGGSPDGAVGPSPSNPGFVTCGSSQCDVTTEVCCTSSIGGPSCLATSGSTACPGEWVQACDEPEDCPAGQFCGIGANDPLETRCTTVAYWPRVCKSNSDCGDAGGGVCVTQSCDGHAIYVSTCGVDAWCSQFP